MRNIWFTSDTHFGHKNICRGETRWATIDKDTGMKIPSQNTRDFETLEEMNNVLVENINKNVKENDILWHLGDWSFGEGNTIVFRKLLNVKTIHLILGNHDHIIAKYPELQKLFSSVSLGYGWPKSPMIKDHKFVLSHFPMLVWDQHIHGSIHLHGHSHGSLQDKNYYERRVMDVGIDCHSEFRPYHIDEILAIMKARKINPVDQH